MKTKICPECGNIIDASLDTCPHCHIYGLNQIYVSKDAHRQWEETVLLPRKRNRLPHVQVFCGANHALILRPSGDLYAMGNNRNGCCGDDQPEELTRFTRIARQVSHAAAGKNHTVYVSWDGRVTILGRSEYVERFRCDFPVKRVYAHPNKDAFLLEDEEGYLYFFGERLLNGPVSYTSETVGTLPRMRRREALYYAYNYNGHTCTLSYHSNIVDGHAHIADYPEVKELLRSDWYRQLVQTHGQKNVSLYTVDEPVEKPVIPGGGGGVITTDYYFTAEIQITNDAVYQPVYCGRLDWGVGHSNCVYGCWPDSYIYAEYDIDTAKKPQNDRKFIHSVSREPLARLTETGSLTIYNRYVTDDSKYEKTMTVNDVVDCAVMPDTASGPCSNLVLLVTGDDRVYMGNREEMKESVRKPTGTLQRLEKRPSVLSFMDRVFYYS